MIIIVGMALSIFFAFIKAKSPKISIGFAYGITFLGLWIYVVTEILSLFNKLNKDTCMVAWIIYDFIFFILVLRHLFLNRCLLSNVFYHIRSKILLNECIGFGVLLIYGAVVCGIAVRIVPYNWDSLSYHLSRILFWIQNQSVGHFATSDTRMLGTPAFNEFVNLHLYLLYGLDNDAILNLTQSVSYLISIFFIYDIARCIGCSFKGGIFAAILFLSTPIVFAESLSTQNDEFAALWIFIFTRVLLELVYNDKKMKLDKNGIIRLFILAISLALGILTKPSGLFCIAALFLWLLYICIRRKDSILLISKWVLSVISIMIILILPEAIRNILAVKEQMLIIKK